MRRVAALLIVLVAAAAALLGGRTRVERTAAPAQLDQLTLASTHQAALPAAAKHSATWCGTTSTTDRPPIYTGYPIRVLYAMPADGADQSATYAPQISDWIDQDNAWWQREDPSHLPRFDMYQAPCGPQVDLQIVRIPSASVATTDPDTLFDVWNQLEQQPDAMTTKYLVFIDDINTQNVCGVGSSASTATLGAPSYGVATVLLSSCNGADRATIAAHELLHAVSPGGGFVGAPHTCPGDLYHVCDSSGDILYPFVESGIPLTSLQLDFGHDDYWAGTAPVNLQVQPWFRHVQDEVHLGLAIAGTGTVQSDLPGVDCTASCATDWDRGDAIQLNAAAANGFRFVQWTGACTGSQTCSLTLDGPKDVSALFAPATFALAVKVTGSGAVTSNPGGIACKRGTCTRPFSSYRPVFLTAKPAKGWRFVAWSGGCHGVKARCSVQMTAPSSVHAAFAKKPVAKKKH